MESSRVGAPRTNRGSARAINVGDTERILSTVAGGFVLLHGLSRLSLTTIVAAVAGGALMYRGLTGHCSAYQALDVSTACGLGCEERGSRGRRPLHEITDVSLAATGEVPPISAT